jgi:hypothetical protein
VVEKRHKILRCAGVEGPEFKVLKNSFGVKAALLQASDEYFVLIRATCHLFVRVKDAAKALPRTAIARIIWQDGVRSGEAAPM